MQENPLLDLILCNLAFLHSHKDLWANTLKIFVIFVLRVYDMVGAGQTRCNCYWQTVYQGGHNRYKYITWSLVSSQREKVEKVCFVEVQSERANSTFHCLGFNFRFPQELPVVTGINPQIQLQLQLTLHTLLITKVKWSATYSFPRTSSNQCNVTRFFRHSASFTNPIVIIEVILTTFTIIDHHHRGHYWGHLDHHHHHSLPPPQYWLNWN